MRRHILRTLTVGFCLSLAVSIGCSVSVGGGGRSVTFTIAGKSFTITLSEAFEPFEVTAGAAEPVRQAALIPLFDETPSDVPAGATITVDPNRIQAIPLGAGKGRVEAQTISGTATMTVYIDGADSTNPCTDGTNIGTITLTIADGGVTLDRLELDVFGDALAHLLSGTFSICVELAADVNWRITIEEMVCIFGPTVEEPIDNTNDNAGGTGNENDNVNTNGNTSGTDNENDNVGGGGDVVQVTTDPGNEIDPQWDPASETIAFQTDRAPAGTSVRNIGSVQADGSGEGNMAVGPNSDFGVGGPMFWVGTTGLLIVNERVVFHEYMTFDTSQAPFTRTVDDGDDEAFTRELFITGGGGGDFITVSRDGSTVLWRFSTNGGSGTAQLRTAPFLSLTGQDADAVGTVQFQDVDPVVQTLKNGAALNPSGSQVVVSLPSGDGFDLFLYDIADPALLVRQLTSSGSSAGVNNAAPDISPDGTQVAFARAAPGEDTDLYRIGMNGTGLTQLTFTDRSESEPSWSPGGDRIAFQRGDDDGWNIYVLTLGDGVPVDECTSGSDCPAGEVCVDSVCVQDDDGSTPAEDCSSDGTCNAECGDTDPDCAEVCVSDGFCNENCSDLDPDPDCAPEPTGTPRCTTSSSFDLGDEGWLILGDAQGGRGDPDFVASGGNPGGHISAKDDAQGGVWFFQAPVAYRGNFSGALGKTLTFDLKQSSLSSQFDWLDVSLTGGGLTIVADAGPNPGTDWTSYSIVLDTSAGWTLDALGGTAATQADILAVLSDLNDTLIRGEYVDGADTGGLDNVVLNSDCAGGGGADCSSDGTCNAECGDTDPDCARCGDDGVCMEGCPGIDPDCGCDNCPGECVDGVCFAQGDISFADVVLRYDPEAGGGPTPEAAFADPSQALGPPNFVSDNDGTFASLSQGGVLELGFTDNVLTNSGDTQTDLRVFEVGTAVEATFVAIRATSTTQGLLAAQSIFPSGDWFDIGRIEGSTRNIDIDQFFPGFSPGALEFDAVQLIDDPNDGPHGLPTPGADIDAVGAIATRPI